MSGEWAHAAYTLTFSKQEALLGAILSIGSMSEGSRINGQPLRSMLDCDLERQVRGVAYL